MSVSYKKLWKLLIDHNMNKSDLAKKAKMSPNTIAKLGKNESNRQIIMRSDIKITPALCELE